MKKRFFSLSSKLLTFVLALLMVISSVPFVAFAADTDQHAHDHTDVSSNSVERSPNTGVNFSDGVFTVTVDTDEILAIIDNGSISREAVLDLIPEELTDALGADGNAYDKAIALVRAYLNLMIDNDPQRLYDSVPVDMTIDYLTQEPEPLLWKIISREELFSSVDLVEIFIELDKAGKLGDVIDVDGAADVALKGGMINEGKMTEMINDIKSEDIAAYHALVDEIVYVLVTYPEFDHICDAVIEDMLDDGEAMDRLTALIVEKNVLPALVGNDPTATDKLAQLVEQKNVLSTLINNNAIYLDGLATLADAEKLVDNDAIDLDRFAVLVGDDVVAGLMVNGTIDHDRLVALIESKGGASWVFANDIVDINKAVALVGGVEVIFEKKLVNIHSAINAVGGAEVILDNDIVDVYELITALGGASKLLEEDVISNAMFEEHAGIEYLRQIAFKLDASLIVDIFGFTRIIDAIGEDKLVSNPDILALINYKELLNYLAENGHIKANAKAIINSLDKKALVEVLSTYIINFSKSVSINGKKIYDSNDAKIDVNLFTQVMAESIPTFDKLANDPSNVFAFVIDWELNEKNIDTTTTKTHYTFGIQVKVLGNTDRLASIYKKIASYISVVNEGENTTIVLNVPAKVASLYLKAVNTDKLPESLKAKVIYYMSMEITDDNVHAVINDFSIEEIASIIENVDFTRVPDVAEKLLDTFSDPYERARSTAKRAVNAMTYDKLLSVATRIGVDKIEDGVESNEQKIEELRAKILQKIDSMEKEKLIEALKNHDFGDYNTLIADGLRARADAFNLISGYLHSAIDKAFAYAPDAVVGISLSDFYRGNGQFVPLDASFGYDVGPKLDQLFGAVLPGGSAEFAMNFLKNTEIKRNVLVQINVDNVYEARFVDENGSVVFVTYLPAGADLSVIYAVPALQGYNNEWTHDGATAASVMPAGDIRLIPFDPNHVHNMVHVKTVTATCTEAGYELWACDCGFEEQRNVVDPLGHAVADQWRISADPTQYATGKAVKECTREDCGIVCEETILPMLTEQNGDFYRITLNSQNTECPDWTYTYEFMLGNQIFSYEISAGANHAWSEYETVTEPTVLTEGYKERQCSVCQTVDRQEIPKLGSSLQTIPHEETGITISGIFADNEEYEVLVESDVEYTESEWENADGIVNVDKIKLMDISIKDLTLGQYDHNLGLIVTIPIPVEFKDRDLIVYHKLHDGTIEKFANDGSVDREHRLTVVEIEGINGAIPAIRFTVYSFSEFFIGMVHECEYGDWYVDVAPTLTTVGWLERVCEGDFACGEADRRELPALSDIDYLFEEKYQLPTCETDGYDLYTYDIDGQTFEFKVTVAATGHTYGDWAVTLAPTEDTEGTLTKTCINDPAHTVTKTLSALNSTDYDYDETEAPTCTATGKGTYTVVVDGQTFTFEVVIAKKAHSYGAWTVIAAPTVNASGTLERECANGCGHTDSYTLPALNDTDFYTHTVVDEPTCESTGKDEYTNKVAIDGQFFTFEVTTEKSGHSYGAWQIITKPTLTAEGLLRRECQTTGCSQTEDHVLPVLTDSKYTSVELTPPTPTENGVIEYTYNNPEAEITGIKFTVEISAGTDHQYGPWEIGVAPTLNGTGMLVRYCECGDPLHKETYALPALSDTDFYTHTVVDAPTCELTGKDEYTNKVAIDGQFFTFEVVTEELGHSYTWEVTVKPTDVTQGQLTGTCANGHTDVSMLPVLTDAIYTREELVAPDCETDGTDKYTFEAPDGADVSFEVTTKKLGHSYTWEVTVKPTDVTQGTLTGTCANGHTDVFTLPVLTHAIYTREELVAPDCETDGTDKYTFEAPDGADVSFEVTTEKLGHSYTWEVTVKPTDVTEGQLKGTCANGHTDVFTLPVLTDAIYTREELVAPDCETDGTDKYTFEAPDGADVSFEVVTEELGHSYTWEVTVKPTDVTEGQLKGTCANGHTDVSTLPVLTDAIYTKAVIAAPDCENGGKDKYTFVAPDGKTVNFEVATEKLGHSYGGWILNDGDAPTESAAGKLTKVCANNCGITQTYTLPKLENNAQSPYTYEVTLAPTCTETGTGVYTIVVDGQRFEFAVVLSDVGHSYGDWTVTATPTKNTAGTITKVCENDPAHTVTHTLPALNDLLYDYTLVKAATCTEAGAETYVYTYEGQSFTFDVALDALQHAYGEWTVVTAPTLTAQGTLSRVCANDPTHVETYTIPVLNAEEYEYTVVTAPLCETAGTAKYSYTYGGKVFEFTVALDAVGHTYGNWTVSVAPTETTAGVIVRSCACDPDSKQTVAIPSLNEGGEAYTGKVIKEPTATESGTIVYTYVYEGNIIEFTVEIPATGEAEEPDSGFPWWILLIILLLLGIIGLIIFLILKKRNDKNDPDGDNTPTAPAVDTSAEAPVEAEKAPAAKVEPVIPVVVASKKRAGKIEIVNVGMLDEIFASGEKVTLEALKAKGIISNTAKRYKVLADGELTKALTVEADEFSPVAKTKILAAGGHVVKIRI